MPSDYSLTIYRGDTHRWQFRLWSDAGKTSPIDLATATVKAEIRTNGGTLVSPIDCTVTPPNTIDALLSAAASSLLATPPARWDLQLTWANGDVQTPIGGAVMVQTDVTV